MEAAVPIGAAQAEPVTPSHKWLVALAVMLGTTLEVLDTSIVNVSLPHMQGSFSASVDEIAWVLTSYLVANGIMIPMTGWILWSPQPCAARPDRSTRWWFSA
jgi:MFS transporter, DHA2 family, multidrug resistance protein